MYSKIQKCRICGNTQLERVLDLGELMLTGVFPREKGVKITTGPLRLVKCMGGDEVCGLLQLEHTYDLGELYGGNYGYRSGLNVSMVAHLHSKVKNILEQQPMPAKELIETLGNIKKEKAWKVIDLLQAENEIEMDRKLYRQRRRSRRKCGPRKINRTLRIRNGPRLAHHTGINPVT